MSDDPVETSFTDFDLVGQPLLNKGTAFTEEERDVFKLHGLLPPHVGTLDQQISRRLKALHRLPTDLERYAFMRDLQDVNETLFYALLVAAHRRDAADRLHADGGRGLPAVQRDLAPAARAVPQLSEHATASAQILAERRASTTCA